MLVTKPDARVPKESKKGVCAITTQIVPMEKTNAVATVIIIEPYTLDTGSIPWCRGNFYRQIFLEKICTFVCYAFNYNNNLLLKAYSNSEIYVFVFIVLSIVFSGCPKNFFNSNFPTFCCIPMEQRCDGKIDCSGGKDEENCNAISPYNIDENAVYLKV